MPGVEETLTALLRGKVLRRDENQSDRDYSGGGFFWERNKKLFLFDNRSFRYEEKTFQRVSGGGFSMPSERVVVEEGSWTVQAAGAQGVLVLLRTDGSIYARWPTKDGGRDSTGLGLQYVDGEIWRRYKLT